MISWEALERALETDGEFRLAARQLHTTVRLTLGEQSRRLRIEDGRVVSLGECAADTDCDLFIAGDCEIWERLLAPEPRPFYQDFMAAQLHHGLSMPLDFENYAACYPALRRLLEVMRETRREA